MVRGLGVFLAFPFPLLGSVAIFVVLHFLLGEFGFRSGLLNEWGMGFCAVSVCVLLLICWLRYAFCGQVVVFEGLRGFAAMERSREYMRGQRLRIAVLTLAFPCCICRWPLYPLHTEVRAGDSRARAHSLCGGAAVRAPDEPVDGV